MGTFSKMFEQQRANWRRLLSVSLLLVLVCAISAPAHAQSGTRTVTGIVKDDRGEELIGVNVLLKGTTIGTMTDFDGKFSLEVPEKGVLQVSYIGYQTVEVNLTSQKDYKVVLKEDTKVLGEIVVTAMGIERKSESLTYATQNISNQELTRAKDVNFINSLQGKSAGLTITPNSSGAGGGSSKIVLRGQSSILGNNQPLIVLDGIPLSNGMSSQTSDVLTGTSRDGGDLLSTINPDDIASISILKGPNAAALYGSAANNGVIIITTKGGREGKVRIDISSNTTFETPLVYPKQQTTFAPEIDGTGVKYNGWGKPIADLTDAELAMYPYLTRNPRNNITDFFRTGQTYNNSIALSGGTEHTTSYLSYGNTIQKGLIPNNDFIRHNLLLKESFSMWNKKVVLDISLNYVSQKAENRPIIGKAKGVLPGLYRTPSAVDLRYFDVNRTVTADEFTAISAGGATTNANLIGMEVQNFPWILKDGGSWINNPYYMLDAIDDLAKKDRIMASATIKYNIIEGLTLQGRGSIDRVIDNNFVTEDASIYLDKNQMLAGKYWYSNGSSTDLYADALASYSKRFYNDNIAFSANVGTSMKRTWTQSIWLSRQNDTTYVHPNWSRPIDGQNVSQDPRNQSVLSANDSGYVMNWEAAVFATAQIGFWDKGYLDVSFRNDWNKAFQQWARDIKGYKSFPYWSIGGNVLLKELIDPHNTNDKFNQLKFRASYSVVGNSIPSVFYDVQTINALTGAYSARPATFDNPKPETTKSVELGLDGAFFKNKLTADLTFYQSIMENQFLYITTSSGETKPVNSGRVRNRGVEFSATYNMQFAHNFRWTTGVNMAYNDNKILQTYRAADGTSVEITVGPSSLGIQSKYLEGGSYGDLYSKDFQWKDGQIVIDSNGEPQFTSNYTRFIGNTTAKFTYGWHNTFTWKDLSLYILLDGKIGGKVISITESEMDQYGLSERSAQARLNNNGMVTLPDGQEVEARKYYEAVGAAQYDCVYDATNIRIRELSLGYTFYNLFGPSKNLSVSFIARNLGFIYKTSPVDPDISVTAANAAGGIESFSLPTTRSFGLNLKMTF